MSKSEINIGAGTAWSYFYGYVKILLCSNPSISERIRQYASDENINVPNKLLILCPLSGQLPDDFSSLHPSFKEISSLDGVEVNVAGIQGRIYGRHSVYKFTSSSEIHGAETANAQYAVIEGPGSLKTLLLIAKNLGLSDLVLKQQVFAFIRTLQNIIEQDPDARSNLELVVYDDRKKVGLVDLLQTRVDLDESVSLKVTDDEALGKSMAYSFFYGYMKIVVDQNRDFGSLLIEIENKNKIKLPVKKVIVICSKDSNQVNDLCSISSKIKVVEKIPGVSVRKTGVAQRTYGNHTVYEVESGYGAVLELATPIRTFNIGAEMSKMKEEKRIKAISVFVDYLTSLIVNDNDVSNLFQLLTCDQMGYDVIKKAVTG